jgi:predicted lipid-binding transport protein (Tim44 family)
MKTWLVALMAAVALTMIPLDADAKRLGGGKSSGMQRDMPARTAPDTPAGKPATPAGAQNPGTPAGQQAAAPAAGMAGAAAAPAKRSWMGPIAGLAAGLGLAALMSHLGMGEGFANFLMIALLVLAAFFVIRFLLRRFGPQQPQPALKAAQPGMGSGTQVAWPQSGASSTPVATGTTTDRTSAIDPVLPVEAHTPASQPAVAKAFVPAAFDSEAFERVAKMIFIRMQAANDAGDLNDLRSFTTPEMFASAALDIQERSGQSQTTEVVRVDAQVLDVSQDEARQIVSVRFHGEVREQQGAAPSPFNEVWHLVKPLDDSRSWAVAGIEQMN